MEPLAVDMREAGRLLGVSSRTIRRRVEDGSLRAVRIGRRVVIPLDCVRQLLADGAHPSAEGVDTGCETRSTSRQEGSKLAETGLDGCRGSQSAGNVSPVDDPRQAVPRTSRILPAWK